MTQSHPRAWLVLLNWRNGQDTVDCLDSILKTADPAVAGVVVCDNASGDDSVQRLREWAARECVAWSEHAWRDGAFSPELETRAGVQVSVPFFLVQTGANLGFAGGNNVGLTFVQQYAAYDFVFLLNNDALLTEGSIESMIRRFDNPSVGMCGCTVVYHHTPSRVQAYGGARYQPMLGRARHIGAGALVSAPRPREDVERQLDYVLGAAMMVSRPCLEAVGLMEERYFLYYEEIDWATRARAKGFRLAYAPEAVVFHKEGGTIGSSATSGQRSLLSEHYLVRSRIQFTRKFYPYFLPSVMVFSLLQISRSLPRGDWSRFRVGLRALLGRPFVRGGGV